MTETIQAGAMTLRFLQSREGTGSSIDMFEMDAAPNAQMPVPHYHESWDEAVYGLRGTLTFRVDGQDVALSPGTSVFVRRGIVHGFRNDTDAMASCLCILTPGALGPAYFREIAALLSAGGPPDRVKMREVMSRYGLIPAPGE